MENNYVRKCMIMGFVFAYITIDLFSTMEIVRYFSEIVYNNYLTIQYLKFDYNSLLRIKILLIIKSCTLLLFVLVLGMRLNEVE